MDLDVFEDCRYRAGAPLPEAGPVVDDRDPLCLPRHEGEGAVMVVIIGDNRDPMGEQHAGRIEFATIQPVESAVACEPRGVILGSLGAGLGERVAKPLAGQHAAVEETLLLL